MKKFTSAYLFQIAREKSFDYLLIIYMQKFRDGWAEGTHTYHAIRENCAMNCAIQGVRLIWKQKIWLAICEFLFRNFPLNQFNFKFLHLISTFCTNFVFLHSKNFKVLGLPYMLSGNQHREIFSSILLGVLKSSLNLYNRNLQWHLHRVAIHPLKSGSN